MNPGTPTTTRRRFLEAAAGAAVAAWVAPGEKRLGTVPFVGEGDFPLDTTVGAGIGYPDRPRP